MLNVELLQISKGFKSWETFKQKLYGYCFLMVLV